VAARLAQEQDADMGTWWGVVVLAGSLSFACGGSESAREQADGAPPGSRADAAPADGAPGDAAPADAAPRPDAATGLVIDSVVIDGRFTQVRQGAVFEIVVAGSGLEGVTELTFADGEILFPDDLVATATEVRATRIAVHGAEPGARDVTVSGPDGSATAPAAFEVTPFVFAEDAAPGGRATFESPMLLEDYAAGATDGAYADTLLFLAGEHVTDLWWEAYDGSTLAGEGVDRTTMRVFGFALADFPGATTVVRDLTIISTAGISWNGVSRLDVDRLAVNGAGMSVNGLEGGAGVASFDDFSYDGQTGGGTGLAVSGPAGVSVSRSRFSGCGTGIFADFGLLGGDLRVENTTFEGCGRGMQINATESSPAAATVTGSQFVDNTIGIGTSNATLSVTDTVIGDNEVTAAPSEHGMLLGGRQLTATDVTITGQDVAGIEASMGGDDPVMSMELASVLIEGGQVGLRFDGFVDVGSLRMSSTIVRDQTVAAVSIGADDMGVIDLRGDNQLSVLSGFALEDARLSNITGSVIEAAGVTLNGNSYSGLVQGPASVPPDYRVVDFRGVIQF
jgi:hypothetical protein